MDRADTAQGDIMVNCKDCKFWKHPDSDDGYYGHAGFGTCNLLAGGDDGKDLAVASAITVAEYGYVSWLETKPDFGCARGETE